MRTASTVPLTGPAGMTEAAFASCCAVQPSGFDQGYSDRLAEDELSYPVFGFDHKILSGQVEENDFDLSPVVSVNCTRAVEDADTMLCRQTRTWPYLCFDFSGQLQRNPRTDCCPTAGFHDHALGSVQVKTGRTRGRTKWQGYPGKPAEPNARHRYLQPASNTSHWSGKRAIRELSLLAMVLVSRLMSASVSPLASKSSGSTTAEYGGLPGVSWNTK